MEARLCLLCVFCIVTGECTQPQAPNCIEGTPQIGATAAIFLTCEERALNSQLKVAYERELNKFHDRQEKAAGDILPRASLPLAAYPHH
jgi:hypothetical protein